MDICTPVDNDRVHVFFWSQQRGSGEDRVAQG